MEQTTIAIQGMSCGHCVASVKGALGRLDGVEVQEVKVGSATVAYDPQAATRSEEHTSELQSQR